jgi:hypothetical protein
MPQSPQRRPLIQSTRTKYFTRTLTQSTSPEHSYKVPNKIYVCIGFRQDDCYEVYSSSLHLEVMSSSETAPNFEQSTQRYV